MLRTVKTAEYIEALYEQYQRDPSTLPEEWQHFFRGFEFGFARSETASEPEPDQTTLQSIEEATEGLLVLEGVQALVQAYRQMGHFVARLDPLGYDRRSLPLLDLAEFGLAEEDLDKTVGNGGFLGRTDGTLKGLLSKLKTTYCRSIGVEYMDIPDKEQRDWLQERIEPCLNNPNLSEEATRRVLARLIAAEEFEQFLHTRYVGQKRFSLEGAESMVPLLDELVSTGSKLGVEEMVIGMAHRGRLNVLAHLLHKPYEEILAEFEGADRTDRDDDEGDVKYHKGYSYDHVTEEGRKVHLSLSFNPSHLELVDPVIEGIVYAKQTYLHDAEGERVVPILIHGEAAFTGQGIVSETLNLSELPGYRTGGSVHIIINNQLGYTAPSRRDALYPLSDRHSQGDSGTGLPRQRRRPRRRNASGADGDGVQGPLQGGCLYRFVVLSPPRPQRSRRPNPDPAVDVQEDRPASDDFPPLFLPAHCPKQNLPRRSRRYSRTDPHPARRSPANRPPPASPAPNFVPSGASGRA